MTVTVNNPDSTPPSVALTAPAGGASVSGTVQLTATASDNVGVVGVQFKGGHDDIGAEDTSAPYAVSWNTTTVANGCVRLDGSRSGRGQQYDDVNHRHGDGEQRHDRADGLHHGAVQ